LTSFLDGPVFFFGGLPRFQPTTNKERQNNQHNKDDPHCCCYAPCAQAAPSVCDAPAEESVSKNVELSTLVVQLRCDRCDAVTTQAEPPSTRTLGGLNVAPTQWESTPLSHVILPREVQPAIARIRSG
jgi:hypothetical protein